LTKKAKKAKLYRQPNFKSDQSQLRSRLEKFRLTMSLKEQ